MNGFDNYIYGEYDVFALMITLFDEEHLKCIVPHYGQNIIIVCMVLHIIIRIIHVIERDDTKNSVHYNSYVHIVNIILPQ